MPPLHPHILIDLEWKPESGGQVMCWQRLAEAARHAEGLRLTLHAQGAKEEAHDLNPHARLLLHAPVFSTRRLPFLGHVPAHTDMAHYHPKLAESLAGADVIHTTDAFFAYARTAEKIAAQHRKPLVHSMHTDTVSYTRIFTRALLEKKLGALGRGLDNALGISRRAAKGMEKRLVQHHRACRTVLASRIDDQLQAERAVGSGRVRPYRLGLDSVQFHPNHRDKDAFFQRFAIPPGAVVLLFVGRLDAGKNVMLLAEAVARANAAGAPLFLLAAGKGPAENDLRRLLGPRVSLPGFLNAPELAAAYAGADYLALPSMVETWSLVAAEALASGLPVIAAASSGVGRFLGAEGAGLLVHANTVEAWQSALQDAAALPHPAALRDAARRTALAHFPSWEQALIEDFVPVWQRAAAETRG